MKKSFGAKTLAFPTPVWCVGTYDPEGKPNIMTIAWGGVCCSKPPCVTISLRKATYTYGNILSREAYTINIPTEDQVRTVDYFGIASGHDTDKFSESGLTPVRSDIVDAPYVKEFPAVLECKLIHYYEIGGHTQFIAEILDVKIEESMLADDGNVDIEKIRPITFYPDLTKYFSTGKFIGKAFSIGKEK